MSCKRAICEKHVRVDRASDGSERVRCVDCLRTSSSTRRRDDDDFLSTDRSFGAVAVGGSSGDAGADYGDQSGGEFGGGGATGGWGDDANAPAPNAPDAFSAEDLAAFDAISEADKDQRSPSYDS